MSKTKHNFGGFGSLSIKWFFITGCSLFSGVIGIGFAIDGLKYILANVAEPIDIIVIFPAFLFTGFMILLHREAGIESNRLQRIRDSNSCINCSCQIRTTLGISGTTYYFHPNNARNCECGCKKPQVKKL